MSSKQHSRRTMLKSLAAGTVAVGLGVGLSGAAGAAPLAAAAAPSGGRNRLVPLNKIGIQLYSVRDKLSGANSIGFAQLFEDLSAIGYSQIEFAGYTQGNVGAITPAQIRQLLDDNGLTAAGSHVSLNAGNLTAQLDIAETLGLKYIGSGGAINNTRTEVAWSAAVDNWNAMGEIAAARGIKLYMHNHDGEFNFTTDTNRRIYDIVWERMNPEVLFFEMDVYWAHVGAHRYPGFRPIDYVLRDPRRYPMLHLKDGKRNTGASGYDIIEFGAGNIDYQAFLSATRDRGQRLGLWEQDNASTVSETGAPFNSLGNAERSYDAIAALRG